MSSIRVSHNCGHAYEEVSSEHAYHPREGSCLTKLVSQNWQGLSTWPSLFEK